jgi:2Fe-2S ferredoxin
MKGPVVPAVTFVDPSGEQRVVDGQPGESVMSLATRNGVPGIIGECGGNNSCATCHVWVRPEWIDAVGGPGDLEDDLLDLAVSERRAGSRLSCQIALGARCDGLVVDVPPEQP